MPTAATLADATPRPYDLATLRLHASRSFVGVAWLHVPVVAAIAYSNGIPLLGISALIAIAALVATLATLATWRFGGTLPARLAIATTITMGPILMVYAGRGSLSKFRRCGYERLIEFVGATARLVDARVTYAR